MIDRPIVARHLQGVVVRESQVRSHVTLAMMQLGRLYRWFLPLGMIVVIGYTCLIMCFAIGWPGAVLGAFFGWLVAGWLGAVLGFATGPVAWTVVWAIGYYIVVGTRTRRRLDTVRHLSTEQLCRIAEEPTSPNLGFALGELERRGVEAHPSLESLLALLTSSQSNRRGLGLSLLLALYPSAAAKLPPGSSNADGPDVWRERLAGLSGASEPGAAPDGGNKT